MPQLQNFNTIPDLPVETEDLLKSANLIIHDAVTSVILHGSRGLQGGFRPDSDIDLTIITEIPDGVEKETFLEEVADVTLTNWKGEIKLDLAVVFDAGGCGLVCFEHTEWNDTFCSKDGSGCFGLFKKMPEFTGIIGESWVQAPLMYPCLVIWQKSDAG